MLSKFFVYIISCFDLNFFLHTVKSLWHNLCLVLNSQSYCWGYVKKSTEATDWCAVMVCYDCLNNVKVCVLLKPFFFLLENENCSAIMEYSIRHCVYNNLHSHWRYICTEKYLHTHPSECSHYIRNMLFFYILLCKEFLVSILQFIPQLG